MIHTHQRAMSLDSLNASSRQLIDGWRQKKV
jgi:hypothetical protein